ncbi:MAG: phenylalanine--tRNA ligase subunit alpha, partial [Desulfobacteraceae bacterium]
MREKLREMEKRAVKEIKALRDQSGLEKFRIAYLGKKSPIAAAMKHLKDLPAEERPEVGKLANRIKANLFRLYQEAWDRMESDKAKDSALLDITFPGREPAIGHLHPITQVANEICNIFLRMGFRIVKGP